MRHIYGYDLSLHAAIENHVQTNTNHIPYSGNLLQEEIFVNLVILFSEEIFVIFEFNY